MKNIHILPTDQLSRLHLGNSGLVLCELNFGENTINGQHIYITSDEEIKRNDYYIHNNRVKQSAGGEQEKGDYRNCKKIILTTDPTLIEDGVQSISYHFLEWFVKNPTCEFVEVKKRFSEFTVEPFVGYEIIIPQEEPKQDEVGKYFAYNSNLVIKIHKPKQETLEKAAEKYADFSNDYVPMSFGDKFNETSKRDFIAGAKWQSKRMYSEEEVLDLLYKRDLYMLNRDETQELELPTDWFKEFKKK